MSSLILPRLTRRGLLATGTAAAGVLALPAILRAGTAPVFSHGVQSGDAHAAGGMVWTRVDRPSRVLLEVSTTESFADARRVAVLNALPARPNGAPNRSRARRRNSPQQRRRRSRRSTSSPGTARASCGASRPWPSPATWA